MALLCRAYPSGPQMGVLEPHFAKAIRMATPPKKPGTQIPVSIPAGSNF